MRSQTRKILIPYSIVILFAYIGFSFPLPIFPEMFLDPERSIIAEETLHKKMILLGVIMASFPLGQFFGAPLLGRLSDSYGRKKVILFSLTGTTIGYLATALAVHSHSIIGMFLGLALCGFCEGNVTIAQSVVADLTQKEEHRTEKAVHFGWINICISIGFIVGPLMGGVLADSTIVSWFTFATPFWMAACMTFVGTGIIFLYSKETLKEKTKEKYNLFGSLWSELKRPRIKRFYLANFFLALCFFSFFRFFPVFLERQFNFTASELSYVMVYDSLAIMAGVIWLIPVLSKRLKPIESLCLFAFLLAATLVVCLEFNSPYALWGTLIAVGLCLAVAITNGSVLISDTASTLMQGHAMGTLTAVQVFAEFLTGLAGGPLAALTTTLPIYIGVGMAVICGLILLHIIRKEKLVKG